MSENTNLVKRWAENIKADAETAMQELLKNSFTYDNQRRVLAAVSEIKGSCEAIISAMDGGKKEPVYTCETCALGKEAGGHARCNGCLDTKGGNARYWVAPNKEAARLHQPEGHSCNTCKYNEMIFSSGHCDSCVNGGGLVDMWVKK